MKLEHWCIIIVTEEKPQEKKKKEEVPTEAEWMGHVGCCIEVLLIQGWWETKEELVLADTPEQARLLGLLYVPL